MGRPELGTKRTCTNCNEHFYDLRRVPATCPKCGAEQPPATPRARSTAPAGLGRGTTRFRHPAAPIAPADAAQPVDSSEAADEVDSDAEDEEEDVEEIDADPTLGRDRGFAASEGDA